MATHHMKVAKCDNDDLNMVRALNSLEDLFDNRPFRCASDDDWKDWEDCDEKDLMQKCYDEVKREDGEDWNGNVDGRLVIYNYVKHLFQENPSGLSRVLLCADLALDNCFDKDKDYIDYSPKLQNALDYYESHRDEVDAWCRKNILTEEEETSRTYIVGQTYLKDNGFIDVNGEFILANDECIITVDPKDGVLNIVKKGGEQKSMRLQKPKLRIYDIRQNLKVLGCIETMRTLNVKF